MSKLEELKKKAAKIREEKQAIINERAEIARLEATIKRDSNPALVQLEAELEMKNSQTQHLQTLVDECAAIISQVPIHNTKTRTERIWNGNHRFNYGTQIDLLYQLATGILYSCQEHKQLLTAHVPVSLEVFEQFLKAFGTPSYYSRNHHTIVEAKPANFDALVGIVNVLQSALGVVIDTSELTENNLIAEFERAETTAANQYDQAVEAISQADFVL